MRRLRRTILSLIALGLLVLGALLLYGHARRHPEDMPWTELDLGRPIGLFTGRKLADLADEGQRCQGLMRRAGIAFTALPPRSAGPQCGYDHAVRFSAGGSREIAWRPADLGTNCAVAAALALWEWHVVQPAARRHFGRPVALIEHFGSYACRRIYGRHEGAWSEHARANAVDIAAFVLEGGRRISVVGDWEEEGAEGRFLREVRDGACDVFATVLSPDYNEAHRDHFHLDQAARGAMGWRGCR
ncbi:MAG: extensin-like domain-containing protein [Sphingosinicella sp.]|uniref:extensin-like domain-containing protein n=1 Tax=Sphingosinicella sp. TaxID=1917971 RepID=UPI0040384550